MRADEKRSLPARGRLRQSTGPGAGASRSTQKVTVEGNLSSEENKVPAILMKKEKFSVILCNFFYSVDSLFLELVDEIFKLVHIRLDSNWKQLLC